MLKYKAELKDAVLRAKARPQALLKGYSVCIAKHVQPPFRTLSAIVESAGGNVSLESHLVLLYAVPICESYIFFHGQFCPSISMYRLDGLQSDN